MRRHGRLSRCPCGRHEQRSWKRSLILVIGNLHYERHGRGGCVELIYGQQYKTNFNSQRPEHWITEPRPLKFKELTK